MSQKELSDRLQNDLSKIEAELRTIATKDEVTGDWLALPVSETLEHADKNTDADAVEEWVDREAIVADLETRYRNYVRALEKLKSGTYGICEISGEPIEVERLTVNPVARTNIANRDRERELPL